MNKKKSNKKQENQVQRAPLPKKNNEEMIGIIERRLGGNKMMVNCLDGKERNCRVPGRLKRRLWLRPGDVVIIELWDLDKSRGDIILKYRKNQVKWLRKKGYLKTEKKEF